MRKDKIINDLLEVKFNELDMIVGGNNIACSVKDWEPICKRCDRPPCCWEGPVCRGV